MGHCVHHLDSLVQKPQIPINKPRTDAFWDFPPKRGFTGVSISTWGERNSECKLLQVGSEEGFGALDPPDCPDLLVLSPVLWPFGDSGHNFLEKGGYSPKSFYLCAKTPIESGEEPPHSHPEGLRLDAELGQRPPGMRLSHWHRGRKKWV